MGERHRIAAPLWRLRDLFVLPTHRTLQVLLHAASVAVEPTQAGDRILLNRLSQRLRGPRPDRGSALSRIYSWSPQCNHPPCSVLNLSGVGRSDARPGLTEPTSTISTH